jgi:hypothetical protein
MHLLVTATQIAAPAAETVGERMLELLLVIGVGVVSYVTVVLGLWLLARRPPGPEQVIIDGIAQMWRRRRDPSAA